MTDRPTATPSSKPRTDRVGIVFVLVSAVGFGTLGIFGIYAQRVGLSIPTVLTYRFLVGAAIVWIVLAASDRFRPLRGRTLGVAFALGAFGYATMSGLYFLGLEFMTAGMVAIVLYTYPAFVVVLAAVVLGERLTRRIVVALALAIGGIVLVVGADPAGASVTGVLIVLGAASAYAAYIITSRTVLRTVDPLVLTAYVLPAGGLTFVFISVLTGGVVVPTTLDAWAVLIGVATVATAVPVLLFFAGIERIGASRAGIASTIEPVVTVALGAILFAEPVTGVTVAGGVCILLAVVLLNRR
ncbi:DMT family transporter [Halorubrum vacuolatum]|uniref:EamA domain-containing membrane protein RarD n=1 Tax=Halorubrum vacuolatum TaxID=63740 RepID=A0A238X5I0_HALVU|nr:DMT family transporter [Halorubrum vacuolatum]SNR54266.1 EamA domain-containing membrane protein RarD [Halorubrum vacuolatum]